MSVKNTLSHWQTREQTWDGPMVKKKSTLTVPSSCLYGTENGREHLLSEHLGKKPSLIFDHLPSLWCSYVQYALGCASSAE